MSPATFEESVIRSAYDRIGLLPAQRDFQIERVVRLAAMATACRFATFCVLDSTSVIHIASVGTKFVGELERLPILASTVETGLFTAFRDVATMCGFESPPFGDPINRLCSAAVSPVFGPGREAYGCLAVFSSSTRELNTPVIRRVLNDSVRLIEDLIGSRQLAVRDSLTQLHNRRHFDELLDAEWKRARRGHVPLSLLLIDVDHFKAFNDTAGHDQGDIVLRKAASLIESRVRRAGDVVCRYGGEEFAVLMPSTTYSDARQIGESVLASFEKAGIPHPARPSPSGIVSVSIGLATLSETSESYAQPSSDLFRLADAALYRAKASGRNNLQSSELRV